MSDKSKLLKHLLLFVLFFQTNSNATTTGQYWAPDFEIVYQSTDIVEAKVIKYSKKYSELYLCGHQFYEVKVINSYKGSLKKGTTLKIALGHDFFDLREHQTQLIVLEDTVKQSNEWCPKTMNRDWFIHLNKRTINHFVSAYLIDKNNNQFKSKTCEKGKPVLFSAAIKKALFENGCLTVEGKYSSLLSVLKRESEEYLHKKQDYRSGNDLFLPSYMNQSHPHWDELEFFRP